MSIIKKCSCKRCFTRKSRWWLDVELGYRLPNNPQLAFFVRVLIGLQNTQDNSGLEGSVSWQATLISLEACIKRNICCINHGKHISQEQMKSLGLRMNITGNPVTFQKRL